MKHPLLSRTLTGIAALLLSALLLVSCGGGEQSETTTADTVETTVSDTTTTAAPAKVLTLAEDGKSEFIIYRSKSLGDLSLAAITRLVNAIRAETGVTLKIVTDWGDAGEGDSEDIPAILIGDTSFTQSDLLDGLKLTQYTFCVNGNKLIIGGRDDEGTADAVDAFIKEFITGKGQTLTFSEDQSFLHTGDYPKDSYLSCLGEPIEHYRIVIPANADIAVTRCAKKVSAHLSKLTGVVYDVLTDDVATDSGTYEILIGKTTRTTLTPDPYSYEIVASGKALQICADSWYGYENATDVFVGDIVYLRNPADIKEGAKYSKHLTSELKQSNSALFEKNGGVRILLHNIWGNTSTGAMEDRMLQTAALYELYSPDVIGLQEGSPNARAEILPLLAELGYTEVPAKATNSSKNNYTPLLYRADTVKLIDCGYRLYAGQNDSGSKGLTWAVFETVATGERFGAISTHFWWQSDDASDTLDRESNAREMLDTIAQIQIAYNCPVIGGGDFNCNASSSPYAILTAGGLTDVQSATKVTENISTHHSYPTYNEDAKLWEDPIYPTANYSRAIDHVFATTESITVGRFDIVTDLYALLSGDHCPMIVDFDLH